MGASGGRQVQRRLEVALEALDRALAKARLEVALEALDRANRSGNLSPDDRRDVEKAIKILEPVEARLWQELEVRR